jgi:general secretion pathway protein D
MDAVNKHWNDRLTLCRDWCIAQGMGWGTRTLIAIVWIAMGPSGFAQTSRLQLPSNPSSQVVPSGQALPPSNTNEARLRVYDLPTELVANAVAELAVQFGNDGRVRITTEPNSGRLMVLAPESTLSQIDATVENWRRQVPNVVRDPSTGRVMTNTVQSRQYKLQRVTWRELEDAIMRIAGSRMSISTSNNGEIAQLQMLTQEGTREILQIDRRNDEVRLQGTPQEVLSWTQVVTAIDLATLDPQRPTQIVPITPATPERIEKAISLVRLASFQQPPQEDEATGSAQIGNPQDDNSPGMAVGSPDSLSSGTGLIGDVDISFVPEMGLVIVKGGKRDVQRVLEVIEQIKKQSAETQPEIELYPLKHVNGVAIEPVLKDLNDKVFSPRQGQISLYALGQPNALLLIGRPEALTGIKELIAKLDQPLDPNNQLRVFRLINSSAIDAETIIKNFFNDTGTGAGTTGTAAATSNTQLTTRIKVIADYRTNSLIVQASPRDIAEVARLILEIDVESTPAENEIRVFPIKNAVASELQPVLQSAISGQTTGSTTTQGGGQQQQTQSSSGSSRATPPSSRLSFLPREGMEVNSGILAGVVITTNPSINALVVRAPSKSMPLIAALIDQLDQLPAADARIKVFPVINGDATSLALTLQQVFGLPATAGASTTNAAAIGLQNLAALTGGGESSLVPLRISVDSRTNSIIVSGAGSDLEVIEVLLYRLDETGGQQRTSEVVWLRNANAQDIFNALNNLLNTQRQVITQQLLSGQAISLFERVDREVFVIAEPSTNSLVISATPRYMQQIREVIERLDRQQPMIFVEMLIAEVLLDDQFEFGTELGIQDSLLFDRQSASGGSLNSPVFNVLPPAFNALSPQRRPQNVAGQGSSGFALGRTSELGYGGLVLAASSESVGILFRMLQDANRAQILAKPTLTTIDNNISVINVGQAIPVLGGTSANVGIVQQNVVYVNAGLTMQIQPRTNEDGLINMIVAISRATIDRTNGLEVVSGTNVAGETVTTLTPAFNQTIAQTRVTAYDGQTVVIGGLISKARTSQSRRVPWLADIPIAGALFRYDKEIESRSELIVVMTPRVINFNDANKLDMIKMVETSRMSWCLADVLNVYGDKGLSPGNGLWGPAASPVIYPDENPTVEFESISPMGQPEGMILDSQAIPNSFPSEQLEGQMYFGDPSSGDSPVMVNPNDSSSSRIPPRSLMRGNSPGAPSVNSATPIQNSNYVPAGNGSNAITPVGYQRSSYQPVGSQPSLSDAPSRTTR